ncbi:MAG TPA: hypothetical protein VJP02_31595 [Candidatus Sulfotelmatobacter sp.]|nr:hypothetical protein [Candidatus Sulfotelmatobacter sp.]
MLASYKKSLHVVKCRNTMQVNCRHRKLDAQFIQKGEQSTTEA